MFSCLVGGTLMMIAVFENRTHSLLFSKNLKNMKIACRLINTPRQISTSCGVSVEFNDRDIRQVLVALKISKLSTFRGVFREIMTSTGKQYKKL